MKRWYIATVVFLGILCLSTDVTAQRKKVGLVLSGGGAKGIAHIGVIEVLEKAGIPIDYVVGTSMGSIVGGLYAIGYSATELDSLVRMQNWPFLLSDKVQRNRLSFSEKESTEKYVLSFSFGKNKESRMPAGFVSGQNVYNLFTDLTVGYHDSLDFHRLPIPFACVAANIVDGQEVVLDKGNLVQAMRASMAIPGVFTPVHMDSLVLVDGGIVNNFPADVAKAMGADIIIGVDVQSDLRKGEKLNTLPGIVGQLINLLCLNKFEENYVLTDLYIKPDINEYSAASFNPEAVDTLIVRGRRAGEAQWEKLMELKEQIGVMEMPVKAEREIQADTFRIRNIVLSGVSDEEEKRLRRIIRLHENSVVTSEELHKAIGALYGTKAFTGVTYRLLGGPEYDLELLLEEKHMNSVNLGFRFDSEEMAAILLNTQFNYRALGGSKFSLTARLSKNPYVRLDYALENPFFRKLNLAYMFRYNDFNVYQKGDKINAVTYRYHLGECSLTDIYLRNFKMQLGLRYEYFDYDPFLYKDERQTIDVRSKGYISYFALAHLETFDRKYYPTKGLSFAASYSLYTDNFARIDGHAPFSALSAGFTGVVSLTRRFKMLPSVYGRVLIGKDVPYPYLNYVGGQVAGRYMSQQLPFEGISHVEIAENALLAARLHFRQRMGSRHYLSFIANYALQDDNFFDLLGHGGMWGGSVGYSYDSALGPIDLTFSMSDYTDKFGFYFNLGFYF